MPILNTKPENPYTDEFIRWLFKDRCIICFMKADVIHEINPRSSGKDAMDYHNRVTLCNKDHASVHNQGTGEQQIEWLKSLRIEVLEAFGREEYA